MQDYFQFTLKRNYTLFEALETLKDLGLHQIYTIEEDGKTVIGGCMNHSCSILPDCIEKIQALAPVDWVKQSALFSPYFKDGDIIVPLQDFSTSPKQIFLKPGHAFGDVSHPTTKLMLYWLERYVNEKTVLDIGSGSGILTFAAKALGAYQAFGVDIDPKAVKLSQANQKRNPTIDVTFSMKIPDSLADSDLVVLMNMTFAEQKLAQSSLSSHLNQAKTLITSGILSSQKSTYLQWAYSLGWDKKEESQEGPWSSFLFQAKG